MIKIILTFCLTLIMVNEIELPKERGYRCPFIVDEGALPAMVLKVKNISQLPSQVVYKCLKQKLSQIETIAVIDRSSEGEFIKEMKRQSQLPISPSSIIQIGKLLAPDHLLMLTNESVNISNIESGKLIYSVPYEFNQFDYEVSRNLNSIIKLVISIPLTFLIYYLIYHFQRPFQIWGNYIRDEQKANQLLKEAITYLEKKKIKSASEALVKCCNLGKKFKSSRKAHEILRRIAKS